jgi:hypothetical protein
MVWTMDETGLWNGGVVPRTYVDPETGDNSVLSIGDHRRDTGVVALSWVGGVLPWFIKHIQQQTAKRNGQKVVLQPGISGINLELMDSWIDFFHGFLGNGPAILLLDQLSIHKNPFIISKLEGYGIKVFIMPAQAGKHIAPCDNFFFAALKNEMRKLDTSTTLLKVTAFNDICCNFPPEKVIRCWDHCGWVYPQVLTN